MRGKQFLYVLYQTTRATFLAQEKNSSLGMIWHLLNPILMTAVLFAVFSQLDRLREIEHYPLFILVGLIHYNFFTNTTLRASLNFIASRSLALNTTVPLEMLVLRQSCIEGVTFIIEVALVLVIGLFMGAELSRWLLLYPFVFLGMLMLSLGASLLLCGLAVFMYDLNHIWGVFSRVLFFLTPILFPASLAGDGVARWLIEMNPLAALIEVGRATLLYGTPVTVGQLLLALLGPMSVLALGVVVFRGVKPRIPDYI